jgi:hypothetical protein
MSERFGIEHRKRLTPMKNGMELRKASDTYTASRQLRHRYQELVGSMMWPATITRGVLYPVYSVYSVCLDVSVSISPYYIHPTRRQS